MAPGAFRNNYATAFANFFEKGKFNTNTSDFIQYKYYIGELNKANIKKYYEKTEKGDVWECK